MHKTSGIFNIKLANIPLINLRTDFTLCYSALNKESFRAQFTRGGPIRTHSMIWLGMPDDLMTLILQRAVVGLEAYLLGAVFFELGQQDRLRENLHLLKNPYKLQGKGTVANLYDKLPSLVRKNLSLKASNSPLWEETKVFYREIRNPIFHGYNLKGRNIQGLKNLFDYLKRMYDWIDGWFDYRILCEGLTIVGASSIWKPPAR